MGVFFFILWYLRLFHSLQYLLTEHVALNHHTWNVERTLEDITLCRLRNGSVTMEITIPFWVVLVREVSVCPLANALMTIEILLVASSKVGIERGNDCLALWPPELHILRVVLWWEVTTVSEVDDTTILLVPSPVP